MMKPAWEERDDVSVAEVYDHLTARYHSRKHAAFELCPRIVSGTLPLAQKCFHKVTGRSSRGIWSPQQLREGWEKLCRANPESSYAELALYFIEHLINTEISQPKHLECRFTFNRRQVGEICPPIPVPIVIIDAALKTANMSESESASAPSKADENDIAIELAAQELKLNPKITRLKLYTQLFGSRKERAPHVKDKVWATRWTPSRLKNKVWKLARERAGLGPIARGGAPRQTT